jgi:hypothetical protein
MRVGVVTGGGRGRGRGLQLPAYGGELMRRRRAGVHPPQAYVLAGGEWRRSVRGMPAVCVGDDWRPGATDWRCLAGIPVRVWCDEPFGLDLEDHGFGFALLWALAIEVAAVAAPVRMGWASSDLASGWWESVCPVELVVDARRLGYADPPPLPAALVADYRRRVAAYDAALVAAVTVVPAVPADAAARIDRARAAATALGLSLRAAAESADGGAS